MVHLVDLYVTQQSPAVVTRPSLGLTQVKAYSFRPQTSDLVWSPRNAFKVTVVRL